MSLSDRITDLVEEGTDLAIRIGQIDDPSLIAHRIGITRRVTVAAASYFRDSALGMLQERSEPQTPEDLVEHNCIVYTRLATGNEWHFQDPAGGTTQVVVKGNLQTDNSTAIREAVLSGVGVAVCPVWLLGELTQSDSLRVILKDYRNRLISQG